MECTKAKYINGEMLSILQPLHVLSEDFSNSGFVITIRLFSFYLSDSFCGCCTVLCTICCQFLLISVFYCSSCIL